ncbi:MAG: hypothetical protein RMM29_09770, partial [Planctomycetota bacterium]|nr:hypothetical protein [Planctomycetota bacterium]
LEQEIAELQQALERVAGIPSVAAMLRARIDEKQRQLAARKGAASASQAPRSSGPSVTSVQSEAAYIATHQTIQNFFGGAPPEDGARLLDDYLAALCDALAPLRLSRMTEKRRSGAGQSLIPMLQLADVFTDLTLAGEPVVLERRQATVAQAKRLVQTAEWQERSADTAPPEDVRILRVRPVEAPDGRSPRMHGEATELADLPDDLQVEADLPDDLQVEIDICRPRLALEALAAQPRTVLLGAPGSGKSTALVYLTLLLAHHLRHPERYPLPFGWQRAPVPLLCPLGRVADALAQAPAGQSDAETLWKLLEQQLDGAGVRSGLGRHLRPALRRGTVALLFDGLDEISARPGANGISLRARVSRAVQAIARE